jgi:hypothetical protein
MTKVELVMDNHVVYLGVQIHWLRFPENVGIVAGLFDNLCDGLVNIFNDRLNMLFPFLFKVLKKRRRRSHFTYNKKTIKINS